MRVIVDADACPVKEEILAAAQEWAVPVVMIASWAHQVDPAPGMEVVMADKSSQAVDVKIANLAQPGDVVVSDDIGLAGWAIARGADVVTFRGHRVRERDVDKLLTLRYCKSKERRSGGRLRGPRRFLASDAERFRRVLGDLIRRGKTNQGAESG